MTKAKCAIVGSYLITESGVRVYAKPKGDNISIDPFASEFTLCGPLFLPR